MTLATIQKIESIKEIPNADNIECAKVLGWEVVVKKGEFKEGDVCIYIEIDSLLPRKSWSEFLFRHEEDKVYRLRTIKLRGQISQGLVLPITAEIFPSIEYVAFNLRIGDDVTQDLEITHYEKTIPANLRGTVKGNFPKFLRKTDEDRVQSRSDLLEKLKGKEYYITTKMDGTSATYYKYKGKFGVCSRNIELKDPNSVEGFWNIIRLRIRKFMGKAQHIPDLNVYWKMVKKYNIDEWLPDGYAIQGEICGPNIQKNPLGLTSNELFIFNIFDIKEQRYLEWGDKWNWILVCGNPSGELYCPVVPYATDCVCIGTSFNYTLEQLLEFAKGKYLNTTHNKEGIVVRSLDQNISFKVLNNDYLLKDEE